MGAKLKSKTHLQNTFFDFLSRFLRVWLQSLKKVLIWPKKNYFLKKIKKGVKNAEFHADFESVENNNFFFVHFFKTFSTDSKSAWNSAFFDTFFDLKKKNFLGHIGTFFELWLQMRRKRLKKMENLFFWMCILEFNYATIKGFA